MQITAGIIITIIIIRSNIYFSALRVKKFASQLIWNILAVVVVVVVGEDLPAERKYKTPTRRLT